MRAIRLVDSVVVREDLPMPLLGPGEALVRLLQAGICATDLELVRGYLPFRGTLGHEFVGVVVEAADAPAMVGLRVVGQINLPCGDCFQCRCGRPNHCEAAKERHEVSTPRLRGKKPVMVVAQNEQPPVMVVGHNAPQPKVGMKPVVEQNVPLPADVKTSPKKTVVAQTEVGQFREQLAC